MCEKKTEDDGRGPQSALILGSTRVQNCSGESRILERRW